VVVKEEKEDVGFDKETDRTYGNVSDDLTIKEGGKEVYSIHKVLLILVLIFFPFSSSSPIPPPPLPSSSSSTSPRRPFSPLSYVYVI